MYYDADLLLLDDILAAVDSHVAALLFDAVRQLDTTRILVTHALHFLPQVDYIITMHEGRVAERGTYAELRSASGPFAALIRDFANEDQNEESAAEKEEEAIETVVGRPAPIPRERLTANAQNALASKETMATGTVGLYVYKGYLKAGRGWITLPLLIAATVISQGFTIMTSYWLVYWQEKRWAYSDGFYEGIYVALGLGAAFTVFLMGAAQAYLCFFASVHLHDAAMQRVMRAPQSFFDATPLGRLLNRLTKDIDTLDNTLADALRMLISTIAGVVGTIVLIAIVQPYFLIAVLVVAIVYGHLAAWYQRSALMFKRIDAVLRSPLYAHFSESLSGVTVIRAYGEGERFIADNQKLMAIETRAYYLTVANQRWLGVRLDALGSVLVLSVAIIVACSDTISPAASGLVSTRTLSLSRHLLSLKCPLQILSYIVTLQQTSSWLVRQLADVQNASNSVDVSLN
jgi:ABC-type multidrug transport system fused ATPase/permease subunit